MQNAVSIERPTDRQVTTALLGLHDYIDAVALGVAALEERLSSVLHAEPIPPGQSAPLVKAVPEVRVPLAQQIFESAGRLLDLSEKVQEINRRLEL